MNDIDLAQRIRQAITLKDVKQVRALIALPAAKHRSCIQLAEAVDAASIFLTPLSPTTVDVGTIIEYGLTQKLSRSIRCF